MPSLVSWKIGGEQGQGIDSVGDTLATTCNRLGYYIYGYKLFSSRIKGGHSNFKIRISTESVTSTSSDTQILVAIDQETIDNNWQELVSGSYVIADAHFKPVLPEGCPAHLLETPMTKFAEELGSPIMKNTVALGVSAYLMGLPIDAMKSVIAENFARKGKKVQDANIAVLERGHLWAEEHLPGEKVWKLDPPDGKSRLLMIGNEAVALGALAAGCRIMAAYPITPASEVMEWLIKHFPEFGGVVVQAEDEIAALVAAIGGAYAGARTMTATAGPGLSLMQEAIGLAQTAEIPVVIVDCQRGGPSTGMPTKHEQSDVMAMLYGSHGDTPRIVLAPSDAEDAFYDTGLAFNLADKYQCPVFIALDLSIALNRQTVDHLDLSKIEIDRGEIVPDEELIVMGPGAFKRFQITPSGISQRSLPGQPNGQFLATGVEHHEFGSVSEDPANRVAMMDKRFRKISNLKLHSVDVDGPDSPDLLLIGFGSSKGPIQDAKKALEAGGLKVQHAQVRVLAPFPGKEIAKLMAAARNTIVIESNATGQLAHLIKVFAQDALLEEGKLPPKITSLLKYDGNPFLPIEIVRKAEEVSNRAYAG